MQKVLYLYGCVLGIRHSAKILVFDGINIAIEANEDHLIRLVVSDEIILAGLKSAPTQTVSSMK